MRLAAASAGDGSAFYHVDIPDDLMSTTIKKGQVKSISPIDIGILADIGIPVVNMNISKIQSVYGNSVNSTQNIIGEIQQTDELNNSFTNLIQTFSTAANSPKNVDLSSFLAQLDLNTQNSQSLQNASGTILSVNT